MNDLLNNPMLMPLLLFLGSLFLARALEQKGMDTLSAEQRTALPKLLYKQRLYGLVFLVVLVIAMFVLSTQKIMNSSTALVFYFCILVFYYLLIALLGRKTLLENQYSKEYIQNYLLVNLVRFLGMAGVFVVLYRNKNLIAAE